MSNSAKYEQYKSHYSRAGNEVPDWRRAKADPSRFASRAPWLPADTSARILDIGCGWGYHLMTLWCAGYRSLEGIDLSAEQAAIAKAAAEGEVTIHCGDAWDFLAGKGSHYDLITLISVIEHIPADAVVPFLRRVNRALVPGGRVMLFAPNMANLASAWIYFSDLTHATPFTELSIQQALDQAGFEDHQFVSSRKRDLSAWRICKPWRGLGIGPLANAGLHRMVYRITGQSPRPRCVSPNLEVYSRRPLQDGMRPGEEQRF